jgi:hypothetical protein
MCCEGCPAYNNRVMYQSSSSGVAGGGKRSAANKAGTVLMELSAAGEEGDGEVSAMECFNCQTSEWGICGREEGGGGTSDCKLLMHVCCDRRDYAALEARWRGQGGLQRLW